MKKYLFTLILLLPMLAFPAPALATLGFSVNPPVTEVLLAPNKSATLTVQVTNNSDTPLTLTPTFHSLLPYGTSGQSTINPDPLDQSRLPLTLTLLSPTTPTLTLAPSDTAPVSFRLESASLDQPSDVYFALLLSPVSSSEQGASALPGITSLILATITPLPALPTDLSLVELKTPILHDTSLPLSVSPSLKNNAPTMLHVRAHLTLTSPTNTVLKKHTFDPMLILGSTTRALPLQTLTFTPTQLGPHTLTLQLTTESGRELLIVSKTIWLLPLRLILILFVVLCFLTVLKIRAIRLTKHEQTA